MASGQQRVQLLQPLLFTTKQGISGVIKSIGQASLVVLIDGEGYSELETQLHLMVDEKPMMLAGKFRQQSGEIHFAVVGDDSLGAVKGLSNRIRKDQHIELCLNHDVESSDRFHGFDRLHFIPNALPQLSLSHIDTRASYLGRDFDYPLLVTGMTGGISKGAEINRRLALAAEQFNIPMGIGSQRMALDEPELVSVFDVKQYAPNLFLIGNLGFAQLRSPDAVDKCLRAVDMVKADALAIHLNTLQELIQVEGDKDFSGLEEKLEEVCNALPVPVIVKEVGCGISDSVAKRLIAAGVSSIDVGGRGGTSWGYIEGLRSECEQTRTLAQHYRNWGIPTAYSLAAVRSVTPDLPLVATGGIRDGHTVAKALALGADMVGIGLPLLKAAVESEDEVMAVMDTLIRGLQVAMLASGSQNLEDLSKHIVIDEPHKVTFEQLVAQKNRG